MRLHPRSIRTKNGRIWLCVGGVACVLLLGARTTAQDLSHSQIWPVPVELIQQRPSPVPRFGLYGEISTDPTTHFDPLLKPSPEATLWDTKDFSYIVTELSPAVLYNSSHRQLTFFNRIQAWGHGGPTYFALPSEAELRVLGRGESVNGTPQSEPWVLVWFAGSEQWLFDAPWLIVLQHRAETISLTDEGLTFQFSGPAGKVLAMPLYGYYKPAPSGTRWSDALAGATNFGIDTGAWSGGLPDAVVQRCRWWSQVLRRFPIYCRETFRVDRLRDVLTIRSEFEFVDIVDDWNTDPKTFSPLSPTLALALKDPHNRFPMRFSARVTDPFVLTAHGPYLGVENSHSYEIEFETLKYIHELERIEAPPPDAPPLVKEAFDRLLQTAAGRWSQWNDEIQVDHGRENFCWAAMGDRWYSRVLPLLSHIKDPKIIDIALASLKRYYQNWVLQQERYTEYLGPKLPYRNINLLHGPGIGSWGELGDAGKFSENLFTSLWSYAHYTGDRELMKQRWDLIKKFDITPLESGWKGFGRSSIAELGDEAPPAIQFARLAWMVGDLDTYYYQCYIATRELLMHFVKQNGADYFRKLQPYHQYFLERVPQTYIEPIPANVFLSNLWGGTHGWQIDGPDFPNRHKERQYQNRWVRFACTSTGRFYRDHISSEDLRQEFRDWQQRFKEKPGPGPQSQWLRDDSHIMPSLVRILSLTLNPTLDEIERLAIYQGRRVPFNQWRLYPDSSIFASALSIIRLSHPTRFLRLVPRSGEPGPYLLGLERSIESSWSVLLQQLANRYEGGKKISWPVVGWTRWQTPKRPTNLPGADLFSFGAVTPHLDRSPQKSSGWLQLNWNSYTTWLE